MSWDDVRTLLREHPGFEIGGHTVEHTDMTAVEEVAAGRELMRCMQCIEAQISQRPRHFSFPYGRTTAVLRGLVREAGFQSACGGGSGESVIRPGIDFYALPRIVAPPTMQRFGMLTSGTNTGLWRKLGR